MSRWWIDEPTFVVSSNPIDEDLRELFESGFRTIISLLDESEQSPNYDVNQAQKTGFNRVSIPIKDFTAPTLEQFEEFFEAVNHALNKGKVVMHCEGGTGRTGTMAAAYWINKGLSAKEAIDRVRRNRRYAVEEPEQEGSLHKLEETLKNKNN